jgi:molybdopterin molybdotransferase
VTTAADPGASGGGHQHHVDPRELVPLDRYRQDVLSRLTPLDPIVLPLLEAHECVLAEDVTAAEPIPPFDNSAMDGYAVVAGSVTVGEPLRVTGEAAAGSPARMRVEPGTAVRIMTGAPVPTGADAIVPVEVVEEDGDTVRCTVAPAAGDNVRPAGEDVSEGAVVLQAGRVLRAADLGMLAAVGRANVLVRPRPRVVVVSTGDELVEPGQPLGPGQIRDSNSYALTALARESGAVSYRQPIVADDRGALAEAFEGALAHADLVVTSGGVSAGRYDLVKQVLAQLGDVAFQKVGMQPGMPQAFGFVSGVPCFGLPGNPVSAMVSFEVFVRPAIRRLQGRTDLNRPRVAAVLDEPVRSPAHKVSFLRVTLHRSEGEWHARTTGPQGSGLLGSLVTAHGLAEVPAERTEVPVGDRLLVHLLVEPS